MNDKYFIPIYINLWKEKRGKEESGTHCIENEFVINVKREVLRGEPKSSLNHSFTSKVQLLRADKNEVNEEGLLKYLMRSLHDTSWHNPIYRNSGEDAETDPNFVSSTECFLSL